MKLHSLIRPVVFLGFSGTVSMLVSCASGPTYAEMKSKMPPVARGHERVFIYRPSMFGVAVTPDILVDDKVVGTSRAKGFIYTDQVPGRHRISISTEWKHVNTFTVQAGKSTFVESTLTPGVFVGHLLPNQVSVAEGEEAINGCKLSAD